jgi:hypothetical protein
MLFTESTNDTRANLAQKALDAFTEAQGGRYLDEPMEDRISDLICDLLHLAKREGDEDADELLGRARMHFDAEQDPHADE